MVAGYWDSARSDISSLSLTWDEAVDRVIHLSPSVVEARRRLDHAKIQKEIVYKQLLPRPSANLNHFSLLQDLNDAKLTDISAVVNVFVAFPNPMTFMQGLYTAEYSIKHAEYELELAKRSAISTLLGLYYAHEQLSMLEEGVDGIKLGDSAPSELAVTYERLEARRQAMLNDYNEGMRELLGVEFRCYQFIESKVPQLDYSNLDLGGDGFGGLYQNMIALELVGSDLSILGLNISRLPRFNAFLVSPSIYSGGPGGSDTIDFSRVGISSSLYYDLDLTGRKKLSIERAEQLRDAQIERLKLEMVNLFDEIETAQPKIATLKRDLIGLESVLANLETTSDGKAALMLAQIQGKQMDLRVQLYALQSKIWVLDDSAWEL